MTTLDHWEALLKLKPENQAAAIEAHRIGLALIELVRQKDEKLRLTKSTSKTYECEKLIKEALKLTDNLNEHHS